MKQTRAMSVCYSRPLRQSLCFTDQPAGWAASCQAQFWWMHLVASTLHKSPARAASTLPAFMALITDVYCMLNPPKLGPHLAWHINKSGPGLPGRCWGHIQKTREMLPCIFRHLWLAWMGSMWRVRQTFSLWFRHRDLCYLHELLKSYHSARVMWPSLYSL